MHVWIIRKLNNQTSILSGFVLKNKMSYTTGIFNQEIDSRKLNNLYLQGTHFSSYRIFMHSKYSVYVDSKIFSRVENSYHKN